MAKKKITVPEVADYLAGILIREQIPKSCTGFMKLMKHHDPAFRRTPPFADEVISFEIGAALHGIAKAIGGKKVFQKLPALFLDAFFEELFENPEDPQVREYRTVVTQRCTLYEEYGSLEAESAVLAIGSQFVRLITEAEPTAETLDLIMKAGSYFFVRSSHIEKFINAVDEESDVVSK